MRKIVSFEVPDDTSYMQCTFDYRYDEGREWGCQEKFTNQIVKNSETIVKENIDDFIKWVMKKYNAMPILYNESTGWIKMSDMRDEYLKEVMK